jgi:hypothetical protein
VASMGSPTPPPGASPTMGGLGGGPGGMLGHPGPGIGTAPTFVGSVGAAPVGASPTWSGDIGSGAPPNSAPTLGGGFGLSDDHLDRRPDSSLGGGGSKGGVIALVVVALAVIGGGGWLAFTQLGKKGNTSDATVAATAQTKAGDDGTPAADDGKAPADDGKAPADDGKAADSSQEPIPVAGGTGAEAGADAGTPAADDGKAPADDGKTPADDGTAPADDGTAPADDGGVADDGGKSDGGGGTKPKPKPKPNVDTTQVDQVAGLWVPKQRTTAAQTFDDAKNVCAKLKRDELGKLKTWRVASEAEVQRVLASGPKLSLWLRNGQLFNTGLKKVNPSPQPRIPSGRVLCVAS